MYEALNAIELYYDEGTPCIVTYLPLGTPDEIIQGVVNAGSILREFVDNCQERISLFYMARIMRMQWLNRNRVTEGREDDVTYFGFGDPNMPQSEMSTKISTKKLQQNLAEGGEFEGQMAKMTLVYIYHQWEEYFRGKIADAMSIEKKVVKCDLMADVRRIRNNIVHKHSVVDQSTIERLKILTNIWTIEVGTLEISIDMMDALTRAINAIRIKIELSEPVP